MPTNVRVTSAVLAIIAALALLLAWQTRTDLHHEQARSGRLEQRLTELSGRLSDSSSAIDSLRTQFAAAAASTPSGAGPACQEKRVQQEMDLLRGAASNEAQPTRYYTDLIDVLSAVCGWVKAPSGTNG